MTYLIHSRHKIHDRCLQSRSFGRLDYIKSIRFKLPSLPFLSFFHCYIFLIKNIYLSKRVYKKWLVLLVESEHLPSPAI